MIKTVNENHPALQDERLALMQAELDLDIKPTLADFMEAGCNAGDQAMGWRNGERVCALSGAEVAVRAWMQ